MQHLGAGKYSAEYVINRDGDVTVSVELARRGGLYAEYFNNAFLNGVPSLARVDNIMNLRWNEGLLTKEASDFVSIHWYGKILAPLTEDFTFILRGDDGFKFYFDNELLIDRWDSCCDDMLLTLRLVQGTFYDIRIEYKELQEIAYFSFEWSSPSTLRQLVPPTALYYTQRIKHKVFQVAVEKGPTIPKTSTVETAPKVLTAGKLSESLF